MKGYSQPQIFSQSIYKLSMVLMVTMMLITFYWWYLWDCNRLLPLNLPRKVVTTVSAVGLTDTTLIVGYWAKFWYKNARGFAEKEDLQKAQTWHFSMLTAPAFIASVEGFGWDLVIGILPGVLFALLMKLAWCHYAHINTK